MTTPIDAGETDDGSTTRRARATPPATPTRDARREGDARDAREIAETVAEACARGWGRVPLLRAAASEARASAAKTLDDAYARAREAAPSAGSVTMPGSERASMPSPSSGARGRSGETLREHWECLRALDKQLANAAASFSDDDGAFAYASAYEVAREWNGVVLEFKAPKPTLKSPNGLSKEEYKKVIGASQWIRGVIEGATRISLLSIEAMPVPAAWQESLQANAKEAIGVRLYNELSVSYGFDPEALADRESFWGSDLTEEHAVMSDIDVVAQLDALEKAEAVWSAKLKEQQTIDSLETLKTWGHGSRAKTLARRLRNSSAYRRVLYARYPNAEFTSLQQMKLARNDNVALAALASYAGGLIRVASSLRERTLDVLEVHHAALGEANPHRKSPKPFGVFDYISFTASRTSELVYELGKSLERTYDGTRALVGVDGRGCSAQPTAALADRSPAAIHFVSDTDDSDDD